MGARRGALAGALILAAGASPALAAFVQRGNLSCHLREIEARQLYFSEGCASLFDYAVRGLGYSKGAAFRRIKAMRLCRDEPETLEKIKSGRLSLCAASQLQSFFEKQKKEIVRLKNDLKKSSESGLAVQSIKQRGELELKGAAGSALREKNKTLAPEQGCLQAGSAPGPDKSGGSAPGSFWGERAAPQSNRAPGPDAAMQKQFMAEEALRLRPQSGSAPGLGIAKAQRWAWRKTNCRKEEQSEDRLCKERPRGRLSRQTGYSSGQACCSVEVREQPRGRPSK